MSNTHKDAPYWVRLNRESTSTHHNHLPNRFGPVVYGNRPVRDENGVQKTEQVPVYLTAHMIVHGTPEFDIRLTRPYFMMFHTVERVPGAFQQAREAVGSLDPDREILYGYGTSRVTEKYVRFHVMEGCTEGVPLTQNRNRRWEMPCTPDFPLGLHRLMYTRGMSGPKKSHSAARNGADRVNKRDSLRAAAKEWNSGYDVDEDKLLPLTNQHRHSMAWDLY